MDKKILIIIILTIILFGIIIWLVIVPAIINPIIQNAFNQGANNALAYIIKTPTSITINGQDFICGCQTQ